MCIARVVVDLSLDREFDYRVPVHLQGQVEIGSRVRVPFGSSKSGRVGYVVSLCDHTDITSSALKSIESVEDAKQQIPENLVRLSNWITDYYCCAREQAVRAMLPAVVRGGVIRHKLLRFAAVAADVDLAEHLPELEKRAPKQAEVLRILVRDGPASVLSLQHETGATSGVFQRLEEQGLIAIDKRAVDRDPFADDIVLPTAPPVLTPAQDRALEAILPALEAQTPHVFLLHGVTGSGKTEVYLQAIRHCLDRDREAVVLVPEISLTPQTTERFRGRFGDQVSVLHSRLSDGERFDEWTKVNERRVRIVVGARSALFAPFRQLGLIVVDEEHETTYKQDEAPRYNARDVAVVRGLFENATVILGSATPSLESYRNCQVGKYKLLELPHRVDSRKMPKVELVDMRAEAALRGGAQVFSRRLEDLVRDRLGRGEQTILFLNRRGYATQMLCTSCGYVATCTDCSIAYTFHRRDARLCCHLCGNILRAPESCPQCHDKGIRYTGLGTEKVESIARKLFKEATIQRMDSDTMTAKNAHRDVLNAFRAGRIHILIGTQMIAKGLDFPNVTLVGVIFADLGLHLPDFRAAERTFQLLTQVAGRAGRGDVPGQVVVQSYTPYHPALHHALKHDFIGFFNEEMPTRTALEFPPSTHMVIVHFRSETEEQAALAAEGFAKVVRKRLDPDVIMSGPAPAPIAKARRFFRYQLTFRGGETRKLVRLLRSLAVGRKRERDADVHVDVDPLSLM